MLGNHLSLEVPPICSDTGSQLPLWAFLWGVKSLFSDGADPNEAH